MNDRKLQVTVFHALDGLPAGASMNSVTAESVNVAGRRALRVGLTEAAASGVPGVDYVDQPTFVLIPADFRNGIVEVDLLSRLADGAPDYARAFAGLAYRITENLESFEAVYVRPLNGAKVNPPGPRAQRAVQYFAYPEWNFERLREDYPDGRYEAGARIGPDEWIRLRIEVQDGRLRASVDGIQVLDLAETKGPEARGGIGLFVDIGTEAFFSNLSITAG
ncbi:family 16 glycoside hydrolase [Arthrobacter sp. NPDC058288]|uniref:family 16 glycoside hydrolase n=1 Tax=Arthrobacter sp. NPDC058288 TaxID=3346424 RepID=UPI0036E88ED4